MTIEYSYCICGCGTKIPKYRSDGKPRKFAKGHINVGRKHSEETKRKIGKAQEGDKSNSWKGGVITDKEGYLLEYIKFHHFANSSGYVRQHRLVIERKLNCILLPWVVVHHKNGNKADNRFKNLEITTSSKHCGHHNKLRVY